MLKQYDKFKKQREKVLSWVKEVQDALKKIGDESLSKDMEICKEKLETETFKVMVVGEFKRGKSTLINAFLGMKILPAKSIPCTAIINEVKYGPTPKAVLHYNDSGQSPREVDYNKLAEYVTIPIGKKDVDAISESIYKKVELFSNCSICENNVEIIDSPGLNEAGTRTRVTTDYLTSSDAIVFVTHSSAACSESEINFIENNIISQGIENIFFICNMRGVEAEDEKELKDHVYNILNKYNSSKSERVFFLSALEALEGRVTNNNDLIMQSGVVGFEEALAAFLTKNRASAKLRYPLQSISNNIKQIFERVESTKTSMKAKESDLQRIYDGSKKKFDILQTNRELVLKNCEQNIATLVDKVSHAYKIWLTEIEKSSYNWLTEMEEANVFECEFEFFEPGKSMAKVGEETIQKLTMRINQESVNWENKVLQPIMAEQVDKMNSELKDNVETFDAEMKAIKVDLNLTTKASIVLDDNTPSDIERMMASAIGFAIGGIGAAGIGGTLGFKEMLKGLLPQIGVGFLVSIFTLNPILILGTLASTGVFQVITQGDGVVKKMRSKAAKGLIDEMKKAESENLKHIKQSICDKFDGIAKQIDSLLATEINGLKEQLDANLIACKLSKEEQCKQEMELDRVKEAMQILLNDVGEMTIDN